MLVWDESFDVSHEKSQLWLQQFCYNLRVQPFYRSTLGALLPNCFIESLNSWMQRHCEDPVDTHINYSPCCKRSSFPYKPNVLKQCAAEATARLYRTPSYLWNRGGQVYGGLKFLKESIETSLRPKNATGSLTLPVLDIKALVVEYDSKYDFSLSYFHMDKFFHEVSFIFDVVFKKTSRIITIFLG